ncbi:MAG: peptidase [Kangiellaceae bacterium]|nr:peptidase [Kangiellaceae bacterium]
MKIVTKLLPVCFTLGLFNLAGCGGSGGGDSAGGDGSVAPSWTVNVFEQETQFKNLCQTVRTGTDPFTNSSYPDRQGSTLHENHWLRSWSNNTYLWYNEIVDVNPVNYSDTQSYFDILRTEQLSPSGQLKDKFHFTYPYEQWQQLTQSGISAGYGAEWAIIQSSPPRRILVAFTEPNTPATQANLSRGAEILFIDGVDVVNAGDQASVDVLNAALFPSDTGESHEFIYQAVGEATNQTVTLMSAEITSSPVQNVSTVDTASGKVGYMMFTTHIATAEAQLVDAFNQLESENVTDLVLDLRYNGGGLLAIASQVGYMIAGNAATNNKTFDDIVFNDKHTSTNPVTGNALQPTPFYSETLGFSVDSGQPLPSLDLERVFILSTDNTCSASEAIINGLRGIDVEVVLIGSTTCGKPYGFYPTDNCGTTYFTVQFRGENDKGFGDYSDGFSPANTADTVGEVVTGCSVADDYLHDLGDPEEDQFKAALDYMVSEACPTPTAKGVRIQSNINKQSAGLEVRDNRIQTMLMNSRIINR